jgi:hypothetical protein
MKATHQIAAAAVVMLVAVLFLSRRDPVRPKVFSVPGGIAATASADSGGPTVIADTGFDRAYGAAGGTAEEDLRLVAELWDSARLLVKDYHRFPLADNADFTAFLQGKNPHQVAWIRPGHPAVNDRNELTDRWGSPLFFHRESSSRTSLRSPGPDRILWTSDDIERPAP